MIKKIAVNQLRTGMYIDKLAGSWSSHPFWRSSFMLKSEEDVKAVIDSKITEIWINTAKGLDAGDSAEIKKVAAKPKSPVVLKQESPLVAEIDKARKICGEAKDAISSMFKEARMGKAVSLEEAEPLVQDITKSVFRNPDALISIARLKTRDDYTYMHSVAVCALMIALAKEQGLDDTQVNNAGMGGLLHDLGKALMPKDVLNKPGKLTDDEFRIMKTHPERGHELLLEGGGANESTLDIALHHHEKMDGSGYPHHLGKDDISLMARMGAVCDVYDAITSNRPYKDGWDPAVSIKRMGSWSGHFDQKIFQMFVKSIGIYPIGSLVMLESNRMGIVVETCPSSLLTPKIKVFYSATTKQTIPITTIDLSRKNEQDCITGIEDSTNWGFKNLEQFWLED